MRDGTGAAGGRRREGGAAANAPPRAGARAGRGGARAGAGGAAGPAGARDEAAFLAAYRADAFARPSVTVDLVVLTLVDDELRALLVRRAGHPFRGRWALPGGFVRVGGGGGARDRGEGLGEAAARELAEETGLDPGRVYLAQLGAFGAPDRDPRARVITVAYYALVRPDLVPLVRAGSDAADARWHAVAGLDRGALAFDHGEILDAALARVAADLDRGDLAFNLVPSTFTIPELRRAYARVTGAPQDPGNFRRRFQRLLEDGVVARAPGARPTGSKPAAVYRFVRGAP